MLQKFLRMFGIFYFPSDKTKLSMVVNGNGMEVTGKFYLQAGPSYVVMVKLSLHLDVVVLLDSKYCGPSLL